MRYSLRPKSVMSQPSPQSTISEMSPAGFAQSSAVQNANGGSRNRSASK